MKMKLPDLTGKVITIKSDQKEAKRCYENNLKTRRGVSVVTSRPPYTGEVEYAKDLKKDNRYRRRQPHFFHVRSPPYGPFRSGK